jgi:hypothetical protein
LHFASIAFFLHRRQSHPPENQTNSLYTLHFFSIAIAEDNMSFKVFIVGDPGVGKTSMMLRFIDDTFLEDTAPTSGGQPGKKRQIEVDGKNVEIILFDTDGQERFGNITCSLYQGMHGTSRPFTRDFLVFQQRTNSCHLF